MISEKTFLNTVKLHQMQNMKDQIQVCIVQDFAFVTRPVSAAKFIVKRGGYSNLGFVTNEFKWLKLKRVPKRHACEWNN